MDSGTRDDLSLDQLVELERMQEAERVAQSDADADADIVLPWWQRPFNIATIVVTVAILAGMVGWMVGDSGAQIEHNDVDTGFLQDMRVHHEQAVLMSIVYRNLPDTDPGLRTVARQIVIGQNIEIGRMIQLLRSFDEPEISEDGTAMAWMGMSTEVDSMPGLASDDDLDELGRASGRAADELFAELMTAHHEGGIHMATFAAERGANDEVVTLARAMADAQTHEIEEIAGLIGG